MVKIVQTAQAVKKLLGRPSKLSMEEQVLMTLQHWREYRITFDLPQRYCPFNECVECVLEMNLLKR
jgi:hypothetical protein